MTTTAPRTTGLDGLTDLTAAQLDPQVIVEPLVRRFPVWLHTFSPATAALHLARYQMPALRSYLKAPDVHVRSARSPKLRGGPFVDVDSERRDEVADLTRSIEVDDAEVLGLAEDITAAYRQLAADAPADGSSLDGLAAALPPRLRPFVEPVYDLRSQADLRLDEGALYRSRYFRPEAQSVRLSHGSDLRPFAFTTPRLDADGVALDLTFGDERLERLLASLHRPIDAAALAGDLGLDDEAWARFAALFVAPGPARPAWEGPGVRVRYVGHAGMLVESRTTTVLVDPFISAEAGPDRFAHADLPERIDLCLITHTHADHLVIETLLRLRGSIDTIVVPRNAPGALQDPSPAAALRRLGFDSIIEVSPHDAIEVDGGEVIAGPFYGEHSELAISAKATYGVRLDGRTVYMAVDTRVPNVEMFASLSEALGPPDLFFAGLECDGAPLSWLYGPLLPEAVAPEVSRSRTLSAADSEEVIHLMDALRPSGVNVYAMGFEPWLDHIMAVTYDPESKQLREIRRLGEHCERRGVPFEVLRGKREWVL